MYRKFQFFIVKKCIALLEKYEKQFGLHQTIKKILTNTNTRQHVYGLDAELRMKLSNSPIVVIANHPTSASVLALIASLPERADIYLFVGSKFYGHSSTIDRYLIPAYINNRCQPKHAPYPDTLPVEEERRRNILSISKAAEKVNKGSLVLIFPGYPEERGSTWYNGVGFLIKQITNPGAYIAPIYIKESEFLGYLRLIPFIGFLLPAIHVYFSPLIPVKEINSQDPKQITKTLEENFNTFASTQVN